MLVCIKGFKIKHYFIILFILSFSVLSAQSVTIEHTSIAQSKHNACLNALKNTKYFVIDKIEDALSSKIKDSILNISNNGIDLITKKETISIDKKYLFHCTVKTAYNIDIKLLKQIIKNVKYEILKNDPINGYFEVTEYSAKNKSFMEATIMAKIIAQNELIGTIAGTKISSFTQIEDGRTVKDIVHAKVNGLLKFYKVIEEKYDDTKQQASCTLRIYKKDVARFVKSLSNKEH